MIRAQCFLAAHLLNREYQTGKTCTSRISPGDEVDYTDSPRRSASKSARPVYIEMRAWSLPLVRPMKKHGFQHMKSNRSSATRALQRKKVRLLLVKYIGIAYFALALLRRGGPADELEQADSYRSCSGVSLGGVHVITSMGSALFRSTEIKNTILEKRRWQGTNFVIFNEESWEREHGRDGTFRLKETKWRKAKSDKRTCCVDVFEAEPWLRDAVRIGGSIDQFYDYAGFMEPCDQPLRLKSGKLLVRKLAAMLHTLNSVPDGDIVIWLDTDVTFTSSQLDERFLNFVKTWDVSMIPFSSNKQWGDVAVPDFENSLLSSYWRIESGVVAFVANKRTRMLMSYVKSLYTGELLSITKQCLETREDVKFCEQIWVRRNLYMDDIFAFTLALRFFNMHQGLKIGWFYSGCGAHCKTCLQESTKSLRHSYAFPHVCTGPDYVAPFALTEYVFHRVGSGYYSQLFRESFRDRPKKERAWKYVDEELIFSDKQKFNNTIEFRFAGATIATLKDELWSCEAMNKRKEAKMWPEDQPLTFGRDPMVPHVDVCR